MAEVAEFRKNPFHDEAVRVRLWDEGGKVAGHEDAAFRDYEPLLQRVVRDFAIAPDGGTGGNSHVLPLRRRKRGGRIPAGLVERRPAAELLLVCCGKRRRSR